MKRAQKTVACLILAALNQPSEAGSVLPPHVAVVEKGAVLKFATVAELSSGTAKKGDEVPLQLTRPLVIDGITLLPVGTQARGRVSELKKAGPKCRAGLIDLKVDRVRFSDGSIALTEVYYRDPRSGVSVPEKVILPTWHDGLDDYVQIVLVAPIVAPFFLVYLVSDLFSKKSAPCVGDGRDYVFPAGSTVAVVVGKKHRVRY
jgi:hypothetical protein